MIMPPSGTFERTSFAQLHCQYERKHDLPPTIDLTQAFLMTANMKDTAGRVTGLTSSTSNHLAKNDQEQMKMQEALQSVSRLL